MRYLVALLLLLASTAAATTHDWPDDFAANTSLGNAIATVANTDTVYVAAGSYTFNGGQVYPSTSIAGVLATKDNITLIADGTVTLTGTAYWFYGTGTNSATGWVIDGFDIVHTQNNLAPLILTANSDHTFRNCTFTINATVNPSFFGANAADDNNATGMTFEDCSFILGGTMGGYGDFFKLGYEVTGWTFTRCTFDLSALAGNYNNTALSLNAQQDFLFDTCTFTVADSLHTNGSNYFMFEINRDTPYVASDIDFLNCDINGPRAMQTGATNNFVALAFRDNADSCDVVGNRFYGKQQLRSSALKFEDPTINVGDVGQHSTVIANYFEGWHIGVLVAENALGVTVSSNRIIGQKEAGLTTNYGVWLQGGRYNIVSNNWISDCDGGGIFQSAGNNCPSRCATGNVITGNLIENCDPPFGVLDALSDSLTMRSGNLLWDNDKIAVIDGTDYYIGDYPSYTPPGAIEGWAGDFGAVVVDSTAFYGQLRAMGAYPNTRFLNLGSSGGLR